MLNTESDYNSFYYPKEKSLKLVAFSSKYERRESHERLKGQWKTDIELLPDYIPKYRFLTLLRLESDKRSHYKEGGKGQI